MTKTEELLVIVLETVTKREQGKNLDVIYYYAKEEEA